PATGTVWAVRDAQGVALYAATALVGRLPDGAELISLHAGGNALYAEIELQAQRYVQRYLNQGTQWLDAGRQPLAGEVLAAHGNMLWVSLRQAVELLIFNGSGEGIPVAGLALRETIRDAVTRQDHLLVLTDSGITEIALDIGQAPTLVSVAEHAAVAFGVDRFDGLAVQQDVLWAWQGQTLVPLRTLPAGAGWAAGDALPMPAPVQQVLAGGSLPRVLTGR